MDTQQVQQVKANNNTLHLNHDNQHRQNREELKTQVRPKRVPVFEANRNKINVNISESDRLNFMYRWVNDTNDRLVMFLEGGWEFVDKQGKAAGDVDVESARGTGSSLKRGMGRGVVAYLMRIPMEIWLEDQAKKDLEIIDVLEDSIKGKGKNKSSDYGSVKIEVKDRP
jgi:hypothetical protein